MSAGPGVTRGMYCAVAAAPRRRQRYRSKDTVSGHYSAMARLRLPAPYVLAASVKLQ